MFASVNRRGRVIVVAAGVVLAMTPMASAGASSTPTTERAEPAPLVGTESPDAIAGHYIVVLDDDAAAARVQEVSAIAAAAGGTITSTYDSALAGFAGALPVAAVERVRAAAGVAFVEADTRVSVPTPIGEAEHEERSATTDDVQRRATWGLDRIDSREGFDWKYRYDFTGAGVTVYVIDTGIRKTHVDFGGRAVHGFTAINDGRGSDDCNGHGTHVAGTVGGQKWGVAKAVTLVAVRVLNCQGSGSTSGVIDGVDWVTGDARDQSVVNMSLGGPASSAMDAAVAGSIASGIPYAVAAGNSHEDACGYSPARVSSAITVGATDDLDWDAWFSNYGSCLDLFAPGDYVTSAWKKSDTAKKTISGTSMASPHVAGVAALYLEQNPAATPTQVRDAIVNGSTKNTLTLWDSPGSPNRLLFSRIS